MDVLIAVETNLKKNIWSLIWFRLGRTLHQVNRYTIICKTEFIGEYPGSPKL